MKKMIIILMVFFIATTASASSDRDLIVRGIISDMASDMASDLAVFAKDYAKEIYRKDNAMTVVESLNKLKNGGYEKYHKKLIETLTNALKKAQEKNPNYINDQQKAEINKQFNDMAKELMEFVIMDYNKDGKYILLNPREYSNRIYMQFYEGLNERLK